MSAISVFIIDANPTFLRIAKRLLQELHHEQLTVLGTSAGDNDALQQARELAPRIILLGLGQYSLTGLRLIPRLRADNPYGHIIVLGSLDIRAYQQAAMDAGADAFVAKVALNNELLPTILRITGGVTADSNTSPPDAEPDAKAQREANG
jgi:DNA-binding NarL/FixJ family response regulator